MVSSHSGNVVLGVRSKSASFHPDPARSIGYMLCYIKLYLKPNMIYQTIQTIVAFDVYLSQVSTSVPNQ